MSKTVKTLSKAESVDKKGEKIAYYSPFLRIAEDEQIVEGIASSEALDSYGDIVRITAIKEALPEYMEFANLRAMHSNIAAGIITDTKIDDTEKIFYITAKVVDKAEWEKVKEKVYKGFSIGGIIEEWEPIMVEVEDKDGNKYEVFAGGYEITKIKLVEISLVDRPANPDSLISSYKAANLKKFDTKDGEVVQKEGFVPSVVLQPDLTRIGKVLDTKSRLSSMKALAKRNPLSILAPRTMSKITKAQLEKVADDAIKAAYKAAGITDDIDNEELKTLSRGEILEAAKELVADVVTDIAKFVKAEGVEKPEGDDDAEEESSKEEETEETADEASEDDNTGTEEEKTSEEEEKSEEEESEEEESEEEESEEEKTDDEEEEEETEDDKEEAEKSEDSNAIVDALKTLGKTISKGNADTLAEIKKSNKAVVNSVNKFAKKAGGSAQHDEQEVNEDDEEKKTKKGAFSEDPWGKRVA